MYSRNGGKTAGHSWVSRAESIGTLSYMVVQLFEQSTSIRRTFQRIHRKFASMGLSKFAHLPSNSFLTTVATKSLKIVSDDRVNVTIETLKIFEELAGEKENLIKAVTRLNTVRGKGKGNRNVLSVEESDDVEH